MPKIRITLSLFAVSELLSFELVSDFNIRISDLKPGGSFLPIHFPKGYGSSYTIGVTKARKGVKKMRGERRVEKEWNL
jgi:hypothetical protein